MVLPDWDATARPPRIDVTHSEPPAAKLAPPLHRLAALIVDVSLVLAPAYVLVTSPLKRQLTTNVLIGADTAVAFLIGSLVAAAVVLLIAYQTLCHHYFGRTLGKRVFGLMVVPVFGGASSLGSHVTRACVFVGSCALGGLPFLAVFADDRRRPLHDRAGDTVVVTVDDPGVTAPGPASRRAVRAAYGSAVTAALLLSIFALRDVVDRGALERDLLAEGGAGRAGECEVVSQHATEDDADDHARVKLALTLYAAGLADRSCLESEVDREVAAQTPVAVVTYLAQAFINADDAEVSNAYLDRVCADAADSVECAMSRVVAKWSESDWSGVGLALASAEAGSGYLDVWGVRHYLKQADYARALTALDALIDRPEVASFSLVNRVKALYGGYRANEGRQAYKQAMVSLNTDEARDLSAWTCVQDLNAGCGALEGVACGQALRSQSDATLTASNLETLIGVRAAECSHATGPGFGELAERVGEGPWRNLFDGIDRVERSDRNAAAAAFGKVFGNESAPDVLRVEAARRLVDIASPRQMRDLVDQWREVTSREAWVHGGDLILNRLGERGDSELALTVADALDHDDALSPQGQVTLAALRGQPVDTAARLRAPASVDDADAE